MVKKRTKAKKKPKKLGANTQIVYNYVPQSINGCHIAHFTADWIIDTCDFDEEEWGEPENIPDLSVDPESQLLTIINTSDSYKSYFISIAHDCFGRDDKQLSHGENKESATSETKHVVTLVAVLKPLQVVDLCYVDIKDDEELQLHSDIKFLPNTWNTANIGKHFPPSLLTNPIGPYVFPLIGDSFLCSQGINGGFTHFYEHTCYAVDLECSIGTPIVAVADGRVVSVIQDKSASGIHVQNLFAWNSVTVELDDGNFVEYVHIKQNSACVKLGDRVLVGQKLCESGCIGFCPKPHLHIQFHHSLNDDAPTVPFSFADKNGKPYLPSAGSYYSSQYVCNE